jgi:RimJ/RimL family protein N-acetyltransferase
MIVFKPMTTQEEWQWMKDRTALLFCEDTQGIVAYRETGKIAAICIFDTWTPSSVNVHLSIDDPLAIKHGLFTEVAVHGYIRGGKRRFFGLVPANNEKAIRLNKKIGFHEVTRVPDALDDGVDYIVMRLNKEDCKWLPDELREAA